MPPNLTDRIAMQLFRATTGYLQSASLQLDKAGRAVPSASLQSGMFQLAFQLAKQGLSPSDLDRPEGREALEAIASTVVLKKAAIVVTLLALPDEWRHVVNAAYRHADHFARNVRP
jgi:hypothetical protein